MAARSQFDVDGGKLVHRLPVPLRGPLPDLARADLVFAGVEHAGLSFTVHVFLNQPEANAESPRDPQRGYAGTFYVFGHGGCIGALGHCDPRARPRAPTDLRAPHALTPTTIVLEVTDAVRRALQTEPRQVESITLVPIVNPATRTEYRADADALRFAEVKLRTYA